MREAVVERYFKKRCEAEGFLCYKFTSPGTDGVPDRVIIGHGLTLFVELKAPGEKPRKLQVHTFEEMRKHGARVYVIDTKEGVNEFLSDLLNH